MQMKQSFFEYISLSSMERIHSQFISWIFSSSCDAFDEYEKQNLIYKVFQIRDLMIAEPETEWKNIDIFIELENSLIVIENKIKSSRHSDQLEKYTQTINNQFPAKSHNAHFFFLTLIDELPNHSKWKNLNYKNLCQALSNSNFQDNFHSLIIKDYLQYTKKLVDSLDHFLLNHREYDYVFRDGMKSKSMKRIQSNTNTSHNFITNNQLETIFQKRFLLDISRELPNYETRISETRGNALLNIYLVNKLQYHNRYYRTGLQIQGEVIKFCFEVDGVENTKKEWIEYSYTAIQQLAKNTSNDFIRVNYPKAHAYVSLSKKFTYWKLSKEEILQNIKLDIDMAKNMTKELQEYLIN